MDPDVVQREDVGRIGHCYQQLAGVGITTEDKDTVSFSDRARQLTGDGHIDDLTHGIHHRELQRCREGVGELTFGRVARFDGEPAQPLALEPPWPASPAGLDLARRQNPLINEHLAQASTTMLGPLLNRDRARRRSGVGTEKEELTTFHRHDRRERQSPYWS